MSLPFKCVSCGEKLKSSGALLFSPPDQDNFVKKDHICGKCYSIIEDVIIHEGTHLKKKKDK